MKHKLTNCFLGVWLVIITACLSTQHEQLLTQAEECMETCPDSTLYWLGQVKDSLSLSGEHKARYALLLTQALHKTHRSLPDDSVIGIAVEYYGRNGNQRRLAHAWLYKGLGHKSRGEITQATEAFAQSELCFEGVDDNQYKGLLYNHYGSLLEKQKLFDEALYYYKKTYECELQGDSLHYVVSTCLGMARMYDVLDMPDSAEYCFKQAFTYKERVDEKTYARLVHGYGAFMTGRGRYEEAESLLHTGLKHFTESPYKLYVRLSDLYRRMNRPEKSEEYALKAIESPDSTVASTGYLLLSMACNALGDTDGALHYNGVYRQYRSDLEMRLQTSDVAQIHHEVKYRWLLQEKEETEQDAGLLACGLSMVIVSTVIMGRWLRKRHRKEMMSKTEELEKKDLEYQKRNVDAAMWKEACRKREEHMKRMEHEAAAQQKVKQELKNEMKIISEETEKIKKRELALLRELNEAKKETEREQKKRENTEKQLKNLEMLKNFLVDGNNLKTVSLVMECLSQQRNQHIPIPVTEYAATLQTLADYCHPGIGAVLRERITNEKELIVCYLLIAGIDDAKALSYAINLSTKSAYSLRKKCQPLVEEAKAGFTAKS